MNPDPRIQQLADEAEAILARDEFTPDDEARVAEITTEIDRLKKRDEQRELIMRTAGNPANREAGADPAARGPEFQRQIDLWAGDSPVRDRALKMLERADVPDEGRDKVAAIVDDPAQDATARWAVASSNPHYLRAFSKVLKNPEYARDLFDADEQRAFTEATQVRAAMSLTAGNGGYLVPFTLDPSVILTNNGTMNPIRKIARVVTSPTNVWHGVSSEGVTAEWLAEATEVADASPEFEQPTVTAHKGSAWVQASFELVHDSNIANEVARLFSDAKDRLESAAFATGNGSTAPAGIVTRISAHTATSVVSATTNGTFGLVDVYNMTEQLPARYRPNASWVASLPILNRIRRFNEGSSSNASFLVDLGAGTPLRLVGKNVYEFSEMQTSLSAATASNDSILLLGDFTNYVVADVVGTTVTFDPLVKGANRKPTGEVGWFLHWRVGADDVSGGNAFRVLVV